ncbi:MAG: TIGR04255 family protein [Desulfobacterales bacterium]|nr:TIGR04255 family protein [Desulfobacterales bacterium]MBL7101645.1 TIGR04255 family protein [Desulfobacteraceae bacterium]MBL7172020.1 TIGR04255 family protein [Desulfobacteraceae bacterium]
MAEPRHLNNAPIREAIIDFRVKLPSEFRVSEFLSLREQIGDRFPKFKERRSFKGEFKIAPGKPISTKAEEHGIHGYFFITDDEKKIAQFRIDGFTFSRLKPYTYWEEIFDEAKELWALYVDAAKPQSVARIAVRYINQLDIPLPITDFSIFLTAPPYIPDSLSCAISGFLTKITTYFPELDIKANIIQALEKSKEANYISLILDIDVYKSQDFSPDSEDMWAFFEQFRELKNRIFFQSITEETARLFE